MSTQTTGRAPPQIGDKVPDGTIYTGISPDTGMPMYAAPSDAPLTMKWRAAMDYAAALDAHGHQDWRLPTKAELNVLFNNRAAIGGFDESGSVAIGWYWSSTVYPGGPGFAWAERFIDGHRDWYWKDYDVSVRPVRSEP